jgi:long-chain fatty acid transport protein
MSRPKLTPTSHGLRSCAILLLAAPLFVLGSGTRIGFKDADATARGNAFAATADNPSAIYYNPAGLTQLDGESVSFTAYDVQLQTDYSSPGGNAKMHRQSTVVPQLYCAWKPHDAPYAFGLGLYAPFGLSTEWAPNSPLSTLATKAEQKTSDIAGVVAYEIAPGFSVGGGPVFHHAETGIRRNFSPINEYSFNGAGDALGFNAGVRWQPSEQHAFGLSYQHHYTVDLKGSTSLSGTPFTNQPASAKFAFPEVIIVGYSYRPAPNWNIEFNIDWTNWNRLNDLSVQSSAPLGISQALNWKSSCFYDFGVTRTFSNGLSLSVGYTYSENSVPDSTFTPAVPDTNRSIFSTGLGYRIGHVSAHLAYQYSYSPDRTVAGSPAPAPGSFPGGQTADGTYHNRFNAISASIEYTF